MNLKSCNKFRKKIKSSTKLDDWRSKWINFYSFKLAMQNSLLRVAVAKESNKYPQSQIIANSINDSVSGQIHTYFQIYFFSDLTILKREIIINKFDQYSLIYYKIFIYLCLCSLIILCTPRSGYNKKVQRLFLRNYTSYSLQILTI